MSLYRAVIARIRNHAALNAAIGGRAAFQSGIAGWVSPYLILEGGAQETDLTFGSGPELVTGRIYANLFAATGDGLDALEGHWKSAFHKVSAISAGMKLDSWVTQTYNDDVRRLVTDSTARLWVRTAETQVVYIRR